MIRDEDILQSVVEESKSKYARVICFILIVTLNLGTWIGLMSMYIQLPLIIPFTPEGWTLPSVISLCVAFSNIMPIVIIFLRWYQGKRFSEIPYIYGTLIGGTILCCILAIFWKETIFIFGRERSLWLIGSVLILSMLYCVSSLVFFDYMKRFRSQYLPAVYLGEGLTGLIPTLLLWIQGVGGEAICVKNGNETMIEATFTQPRYSVTFSLFVITGITILSLIAFIILRWSNIVSLADARQPIEMKIVLSKITSDDVVEEGLPMTCGNESVEPSKSIKQSMTEPFVFLLFLNSFNSFLLLGLLRPLTAYTLLPYGQKTLYYFSLLNPLSYPIALVLCVRWPTIPTRLAIIGSIFAYTLGIFAIIIAAQSPCPWWSTSLHGGKIMIFILLSTAVIMTYIRFTIGNRIKSEWLNDKGMFYFGATDQIGSIIGAIPMYFFVNVLDLFTERKACEIYCVT